MSDVANSTNQIQFCLFASGGKISVQQLDHCLHFPWILYWILRRSQVPMMQRAKQICLEPFTKLKSPLEKLSVCLFLHFLWKSQTMKGTFFVIFTHHRINEYMIELWCFWGTWESHYSLRLATNLENLQNSGNLKNCQNLRGNSWKLLYKKPGKLRENEKYVTWWPTKCTSSNFSFLSCSRKKLKISWKSQGKLREFSFSKMWSSCLFRVDILQKFFLL